MSDDETTRRDLALLGERLDDVDGSLWKTTLRALGSPGGQEPLSPEHREQVAGQVHAEAPRDEPGHVVVEFSAEFVERFVECYGLEDLGDVDDLLGRESHERDNYVGQVQLLRDRDEEEVVDSILDNVSPDGKRADPGREEW